MKLTMFISEESRKFIEDIQDSVQKHMITEMVKLTEYSIEQLLLHGYDEEKITITHFQDILTPIAMIMLDNKEQLERRRKELREIHSDLERELFYCKTYDHAKYVSETQEEIRRQIAAITHELLGES